MNEPLRNKCLEFDFEKCLKKKEYKYFTSGKYNLNIIGVRASGKTITNKFDDILVVTYKDEKGAWQRHCYSITTDPGAYYMTHLCSSKGCAIMVEGQYRGLWKIGYHKGQYKALVQNKPVAVYRDRNKDEIYDYNPQTVDNGIFGINLHRSGKTESVQVDKWSAGCQVFASAMKFNEFLKLCDKQVACKMGETFTYTLLSEDDLA